MRRTRLTDAPWIAWGPCPEPCPPACTGDLDGDCTVGITDLLTLLANWS